MNPIRLSGHVLLWSGFFGGVFLAVQNVEVPSDKWSTIHWPLYGLSLVVGVAGVVMLRLTQKHMATHADKLDSDIKLLEVSIKDLLAQLASLIKSKHTIEAL